MSSASSDPLGYRAPALVLGVLDYVYASATGVAWDEVVDLFSSGGTPWRTVEATLYDLVAYGALHRIGRPGTRRRPDTRALRATPLGRAWLDRDLLALPGAGDVATSAPDDVATSAPGDIDTSGHPHVPTPPACSVPASASGRDPAPWPPSSRS
jgi:hypothetical protein